jgi:S-adenosylmethionine:tRNA ribosyltransferase-isomerase
MKLSDFDYNLPKELIAQYPASPRDSSRLLVFDKSTGAIEHKHFYDIVDYFKKGDVLVLNNSKVFPARLIGKRADTGGRIEIFLLRGIIGNKKIENRKSKIENCIWSCLVGGKVRGEGMEVEFGDGFSAVIEKKNNDGTWQVNFNKSGSEFMQIVNRIGEVPLPPYIKRKKSPPPPFNKGGNAHKDKNNYQTIYADENKSGSVAAPTAGLHFTKQLLAKLKKKGVQIEYITLHVGLGTFAPVKADDITKHKMHSEYVEADKKTIGQIIKAKQEKRRIIAVGTTSARTLEAIATKFSIYNLQFTINDQFFNNQCLKKIQDFSGFVNIFIYPPYEFKIVGGMITNFHLPKSTLMMLVSALAGRENIMQAYQAAINEKYRFFSYGDAMLIL